MDIVSYSDDVQCDFVLGVACIRHGYWLGNINAEDTLIYTAPCQYPYCKTDLPPCPIIGLAQTYNQLTIAQDEQCNGLYGGLLCRSCREYAMFSFEAVKWCKSKKSTGKNTNEEEMINLLQDEEEEEVVDSGDRDIHIGVSSTVYI